MNADDVDFGVGITTPHKLTGLRKVRSRSHDAVIRVYDVADNVIETHEHKGKFKLSKGSPKRHKTGISSGQD